MTKKETRGGARKGTGPKIPWPRVGINIRVSSDAVKTFKQNNPSKNALSAFVELKIMEENKNYKP